MADIKVSMELMRWIEFLDYFMKGVLEEKFEALANYLSFPGSRNFWSTFGESEGRAAYASG